MTQLDPPPQIEPFNYIWRKWVNNLYTKVLGLPVQTSGAFTPTIFGSTTAGVGTYSAQVGYYVKTGVHFHAQIYVDWTAHTGTGTLNVSLPVPHKVSSSLYASVVIGQAYNVALTANHILGGDMLSGDSFISLRQYPVGGGAVSPAVIDASGYLIISIDYITD